MGKGPTRRGGHKKSALRPAGDGGRAQTIAEHGLGAWRPAAASFKTGRDKLDRPKHKKQDRDRWDEG